VTSSLRIFYWRRTPWSESRNLAARYACTTRWQPAIILIKSQNLQLFLSKLAEGCDKGFVSFLQKYVCTPRQFKRAMWLRTRSHTFMSMPNVEADNPLQKGWLSIVDLLLVPGLFWRNQNVVSVLKVANLNKLVHKGQHFWSFPTVWIPWWKHSVRGKVDASTGVCFAIILFMKVVSKMTCWRRSELTPSCYLLFVPKSPKTRPVDERVPTVW